MGGHPVSQPVRLIADGLDHGRRHLQLAGGPLGGGIQNAAGDHQLDQIHILGVGLLQLLQGHGVVLGGHGHRACHVPAGHRDALVGGEDAGGKDLAPGRIVPAAGVKVGNAAYRAQGRHAAQKLLPGVAADHPVGHRPGEAVAQDPAHQGRVVPGLGAGGTVPGQMDVQVDQARHQPAALQIDLFVSRTGGAVLHDVRDRLIIHQDHFVQGRLHLLGAVQQNAVVIGSPHRLFILSGLALPAGFSSV